MPFITDHIHMLRHSLAPVIGRLDVATFEKLLLTLVLCGAIGLERSTHERASGFRTHILVGLGACLITLSGAYGFPGMVSADRDPLRLATYVVSGIGFLGAGAILRHGTSVRGLTTAASIWSVAGVGIAVASGLGALAAVTVGLILFTLVPLERWEARLNIGETATTLAVHLSNDVGAVGKTLAALTKQGVHVRRATVVPGAGTTAILRVELAAALKSADVSTLVGRLLALKCVERVDTASLHPDENQPQTTTGSRRRYVVQEASDESPVPEESSMEEQA